MFHWSVERTPKGPRFCYTVSGSQEEQVWRTVRRSGEVPTSFHPTKMPGHNWRITTGRQLNMWQASADVGRPRGQKMHSVVLFLILSLSTCAALCVCACVSIINTMIFEPINDYRMYSFGNITSFCLLLSYVCTLHCRLDKLHLM